MSWLSSQSSLLLSFHYHKMYMLNILLCPLCVHYLVTSTNITVLHFSLLSWLLYRFVPFISRLPHTMGCINHFPWHPYTVTFTWLHVMWNRAVKLNIHNPSQSYPGKLFDRLSHYPWISKGNVWGVVIQCQCLVLEWRNATSSECQGTLQLNGAFVTVFVS